MKLVAPSYYKDFTCIADRCRHSCCIGWEIDIDHDTYEYYKTVPGEFGDRLRSGISCEDQPCFRLGKDDRCVFLNDRGLCDIILTLGEDALCGICSDHPRFRNFFADRTEMGLGLTCEEACRLILSENEPMALVVLEDDGDDAADLDDLQFFEERGHAIDVLQNRKLTLAERFSALCEEHLISEDTASPKEWTEFYRSLERLDPAWDKCLDTLADADTLTIPEGAKWENLAVYLVYRHSANYGVADSVAFAMHGVKIISAMSKLGVEEVCRMWSSEIEYSEENTDIIMDKLTI